jgi:hypothetical protein
MDESVSSESAQHTPGPWLVLQVPTSAGSAFRIGTAGAEKGCAWVYADGIRKGIDDSLPRAQELAANARLIAAAPDLLKALKNLCRTFPTDSDMIAAGWDGLDVSSACSAYDEAKAVIAKATS